MDGHLDALPGEVVLPQAAQAHTGCVVALQRSPFIPGLVLSVDAWMWALWEETHLHTPLLTSRSPPAPYHVAAFSPTRPGVQSQM